MCACHRIHHQRLKSTGAEAIIARRTDNHDYGQDRDEWHIDSYRYNSDSVRMFDSIGIVELDAYHNIDLAGVGNATRKKIWEAFKGGQYNASLVHKNKEQEIGPNNNDHDDHDKNLRHRSGQISPAGYEGVRTRTDTNNQGSQPPP